jgi:hypothetical protein
VRSRRDKGSKIANAKVNALRLREPMRRKYFSCARSGVFIGKRGVPLRLLARDNRNWCESCASVFLIGGTKLSPQPARASESQ